MILRQVVYVVLSQMEKKNVSFSCFLTILIVSFNGNGIVIGAILGNMALDTTSITSFDTSVATSCIRAVARLQVIGSVRTREETSRTMARRLTM